MWTRDRQWVCLHDWHSSLIDGDGTQLTYAEFQNRNAASPELELCTLDTLADWLRKNPGPRVLLDPKGDALELARVIAGSYPDLRDRFIPQIFQPDDYS
jgi:hypothetical protein